MPLLLAFPVATANKDAFGSSEETLAKLQEPELL